MCGLCAHPALCFVPQSDAEAVPQPRASAPATADPTTLSGSNNGRKRERDLNPYEALHHIKPGSPASLWQGAGQRVVLHLSQTGTFALCPCLSGVQKKNCHHLLAVLNIFWASAIAATGCPPGH